MTPPPPLVVPPLYASVQRICFGFSQLLLVHVKLQIVSSVFTEKKKKDKGDLRSENLDMVDYTKKTS